MSVFSNPAGRARDAAAAYSTALVALIADRDPLAILTELPAALGRLLDGLSDAELRTSEAPGKWSILQVVDHLADQETVNAFRFRVVVAEDDPPLQGYDQDRWAARLRYGDAGAATLLAELGVLRARNLRLLTALGPDEWPRAGRHQERGSESVEHIVRLNAGHDLVHRRQIARIRTRLGKPVAEP